MTFEGQYTQIEGGSLNQPHPPFPSLYFGGASPAAEQVAAQHSDVYLLWGETPEMVAERLARMSALAREAGRQLRFGIRLHVIARRTEKEAWQEAQRLLDGLSPATIAAAQNVLQKTESTGQKRMLALHQGRIPKDARELEVRPNLWTGIGLVRSGAGTALVGSYQQVTARIREYAELGLDSFIFSAYPNLEEAYRFGEQITPRLRFVTQERNSS
jgi:alkanesulfonate monooxygenase